MFYNKGICFTIKIMSAFCIANLRIQDYHKGISWRLEISKNVEISTITDFEFN